MIDQSSQRSSRAIGRMVALALIVTVSGLYGCGEAEKAPVETPVKPAEKGLQSNPVKPENN